jgi:hypothetical protein
MTYQFWRLSEASPNNLGLAFTDAGLFLGQTPLIEERAGRFVVRERDEIERLLRRAYGGALAADRLMPGLATVASALNTNDQCLARIAAVQLRIPDLANQAARDAIEAEDSLIKYAREAGGSADWNPALHPRSGVPPNPGWFAPTGGPDHASPEVRIAENKDDSRRTDATNDEWVKLPPGKYIDELADFTEWIANAKPEDERIIRAEIKRYYYDVGDLNGGNALTAALSRAVQPGVTTEDRQLVAKWVALHAHNDPAAIGQDLNLINGALLLLSPWIVGRALPKLPAVPSEIEFEVATIALSAEQRAAIWKLPPTTRGKVIDKLFRRGNLHELSRTIDDFIDKTAISNKSIDLNAATYQHLPILRNRVAKYLAELEAYAGTGWGSDSIEASDIASKVLRLIIPKDSMMPLQREVIEAATKIAKSKNLRLIVTEF